MAIVLTGVYQDQGDCWIAWVEELPGANTQGRTLEEAKENLQEAISMVLEARREMAEQELEGKNVIREQFCLA
jgi:predicted RNase H-like HicB family nuclease